MGQFDPQTVRMVFELKQNVKPQLFALAPVAGFKERLVMDLYPANATDVQDPAAGAARGLQQRRSGAAGAAGAKRAAAGQSRARPADCHHARSRTAAKTPVPWGSIAPAKDVVLQIARRLRALIDKEGNMKAYMTRNEDVFIR